MNEISDLPPCRQWFLYRTPGKLSEWINLLSVTASLANFYCQIPSGAEYSERVGAPKSFSGILLAVVPITAILVNFLWNFLVDYTKSFRKVKALVLLLNIFANITFGMAATSNSKYVLLVSKILLGASGNSGLSLLWTTRSFGKEKVKPAVYNFSMSLAWGVVSGSIIAAILSPLKARLGPFYFDEDTLPGWFFALASIVLLLFVLCFFEEPQEEVKCAAFEMKKMDKEGVKETDCEFCGVINTSSAKGDEGGKGGEQTNETKGKHSKKRWWVKDLLKEYAPSFALIFILTCNRTTISTFETSAPLVANAEFSWSVMNVCIYLGILGLFVIPSVLLSKKYMSSVSEHKTLIAALLANASGAIIMMKFSPNSFTPYQYSVGGLFVFVSLTFIYSSAQSLLIKVFPSKPIFGGKVNISMISFITLQLGRALGAVYGSRFTEYSEQENFIMAFILAMNGICLFLVFYFLKDFTQKKD
eukprot:Nk52_evm2s689 gene=Nk52_evmTU2s689